MPGHTFCWFHHLDYIDALVLLLSTLSADVQTEWYTYIIFPTSLFRALNPQPLRYWCNALPTELSKTHESGHVWGRHYMFSGHYTWLKHMNSMVIDVQQQQRLWDRILFRAWKFFQVIFPVVLWLHSHLSFLQYLVLLDIYYHELYLSVKMYLALLY